MTDAPARQPNFALLLGGAWLVAVLQLVLQFWPETAETLFDTDDAMRLVQVRAFLAGQNWFDLHEARLQPPAGYDSHWSRLIDAGLAGLFLLLRPFVDIPLAERLMRAVWPMLWLLPAIGGVATIAWRIGGRNAAVLVLLFAAIGLPAFQPFKPGRIDHHNVQVALTVLTVAATVWVDRVRWSAWAAGALTGLAFAIGFECAHYLALCGAAVVARYIVDSEGAPALRAYGLSLAGAAAVMFLVSVGPGHWGRSACDAIAINSAAALIVGGPGAALITFWRSDRAVVRSGFAAAAGAAAVLVFVLGDPRCLGGPFAMVDAAVRPIWLMQVQEMQPLLALLAQRPLAVLGVASFPLAAALSVFVLASGTPLRHDFGFLVAAGALLLAVATMFAAIRAQPYAIWLGMPLVAVLALQLFGAMRIERLVPRFIAGLLLTPMAVSLGAISIAQAAGLHDPDNPIRGEQRACFKSAHYAPLATVPAGLVMADVDYGPFLLAHTPHSVIAAPYHRLAAGITTSHEAFASPPDQARQVIVRSGAHYVAICGLRPPVGLTDAERAASLWSRLQAGELPDWLEPVPETSGQPFSLYRVKL